MTLLALCSIDSSPWGFPFFELFIFFLFFLSFSILLHLSHRHISWHEKHIHVSLRYICISNSFIKQTVQDWNVWCTRCNSTYCIALYSNVPNYSPISFQMPHRNNGTPSLYSNSHQKNHATSLRFLKKGPNLYPQLKFFPPIILWRDRYRKKYLMMTLKITKISSTNMSATKLWITDKLRMMLIVFSKANLLMKGKGKRKSWLKNRGKQENWSCETRENTLKLWDLPISKKLMRHFVRLHLWRKITRK